MLSIILKKQVADNKEIISKFYEARRKKLDTADLKRLFDQSLLEANGTRGNSTNTKNNSNDNIDIENQSKGGYGK